MLKFMVLFIATVLRSTACADVNQLVVHVVTTVIVVPRGVAFDAVIAATIVSVLVIVFNLEILQCLLSDIMLEP